MTLNNISFKTVLEAKARLVSKGRRRRWRRASSKSYLPRNEAVKSGEESNGWRAYAGRELSKDRRDRACEFSESPDWGELWPWCSRTACDRKPFAIDAGLWTSSINITWEIVRTMGSQPVPDLLKQNSTLRFQMICEDIKFEKLWLRAQRRGVRSRKSNLFVEMAGSAHDGFRWI